MTHESAPVALGPLVRRNRRRYGGYIVHAGLAMRWSASPRRPRSSTRGRLRSPGPERDGRRLQDPLRAPDRVRSAAEDLVRRGARRHQGRQARHDAHDRAGCTPPRTRRRASSGGSSTAPTPRARSGSTPGCAGHLDGDQRRTDAADPLINQGNTLFASYAPQVMTKAAKLPPAEASRRSTALGRARPGVSETLAAVRHPPVADRVPAHRLAAGDVAVARSADHRRGGLIALWPVPSLARRAHARPRRPAGGLGARRAGRSRSASWYSSAAERRRRGSVPDRAGVLAAVVVFVSAPLGGRSRAGTAPAALTWPGVGAGRARGRARCQVPRDPRRRARPPDREAVRRGLRRARPEPAGRGDRDHARARLDTTEPPEDSALPSPPWARFSTSCRCSSASS